VYALSQPQTDAVVEDKRTWRGGERPGGSQGRVREKPWTAMEVLTGYADAKGWVTAKAGRSDVHRAGNASAFCFCFCFVFCVDGTSFIQIVMRALAEGRVAWAFWPPDTDVDLTSDETDDGMGIWIPRTAEGGAMSVEEESEAEEEERSKSGEESQEDGPKESEEEEEEEEEDEEGEEEPKSTGIRVGAGRFGALVEDVESEEETDGSS
jgi:hypothetical protein